MEQLPEDSIPDELLQAIHQLDDLGVIDEESSGYVPEEDDGPSYSSCAGALRRSSTWAGR